MMAILGIGDYLCEACKYFDTDGNDGNSPFCYKQGGLGLGEPNKAIKLGEECPYGYEFGVPTGYPVSVEFNKPRAYKIKAKLDKLRGDA